MGVARFRRPGSRCPASEPENMWRVPAAIEVKPPCLQVSTPSQWPRPGPATHDHTLKNSSLNLHHSVYRINTDEGTRIWGVYFLASS